MLRVGRVLRLPVGWIVFFDGECGLCSRIVRLLARLDRREALKFAPIQGETAAEFGIEVPAADGGTIVVMREDGVSFERGDAALELARALGWPWRAGRVFGLVPRSLRDAAYDFVAKRRRAWFRPSDACLAPSAGLRARMLR
jgi:predicted DCC family thiol-disulfide oxidoreductase YuxK